MAGYLFITQHIECLLVSHSLFSLNAAACDSLRLDYLVLIGRKQIQKDTSDIITRIVCDGVLLSFRVGIVLLAPLLAVGVAVGWDGNLLSGADPNSAGRICGSFQGGGH